MQRFRLSALLLLIAHAPGAMAQGFLTWGNNLTGFRATIYRDFDTPPPLFPPPLFPGVLLSGTGYTFGVYYGPASAANSAELTLLVSTTFRTGTGTGLPNGLVNGGTLTVPGINPGEPLKFQIRAWDNLGGTLNAWDQVALAWASGLTRAGHSPMVLSGPLGGVGTDGIDYFTPATVGWSPFAIHVPEPSAVQLGAVAGIAFLGAFWRRRNRLGAGPRTNLKPPTANP